jgi:hypothetical protein
MFVANTALSQTPCGDEFRPYPRSRYFFDMFLSYDYNITNLFVFDLANQRAERSVAEYRLNKPWRGYVPRQSHHGSDAMHDAGGGPSSAGHEL